MISRKSNLCKTIRTKLMITSRKNIPRMIRSLNKERSIIDIPLIEKSGSNLLRIQRLQDKLQRLVAQLNRRHLISCKWQIKWKMKYNFGREPKLIGVNIQSFSKDVFKKRIFKVNRIKESQKRGRECKCCMKQFNTFSSMLMTSRFKIRIY